MGDSSQTRQGFAGWALLPAGHPPVHEQGIGLAARRDQPRLHDHRFNPRPCRTVDRVADPSHGSPPRGEDELPVRQPQQKLLVHILAQKQGTLLRTGGTKVEYAAAEGPKVLQSAVGVRALDNLVRMVIDAS